MTEEERQHKGVQESTGGSTPEIMKQPPLNLRPPSPSPKGVFLASLFFLKKLSLPPGKCVSFSSMGPSSTPGRGGWRERGDGGQKAKGGLQAPRCRPGIATGQHIQAPLS